MARTLDTAALYSSEPNTTRSTRLAHNLDWEQLQDRIDKLDPNDERARAIFKETLAHQSRIL
jgi:hypothetical protein